MPNVLDLKNVINPDRLAVELASKYDVLKSARNKKEIEWREIRNYVFATDTKTTTNSKLPWRNSTTRPKLCQIRDNLHANYMAALFPTTKWFKWIPSDRNSASKDKAMGIEAYLQNKLEQGQFRDFISKAVYDYIDYGNCFASVEYVREAYRNDEGEEVVAYEGPRPVRISPLDIVFDITARDFAHAPKIVRKLYSMGDLQKIVDTMPQEDAEPYKKALDKLKANRATLQDNNKPDQVKADGFIADGFGSISLYYSSGLVEVLEFFGDYYDVEEKQAYSNYRVVVVDRAYVVEKEPIENWLGKAAIVHAGWRARPDNLWAMGPLDNLVGLQYRIDHLENLKADVFDLIAFPPIKQRGYVEDWNWGPNERIFMNEDADVEMLQVPATVLSADQQIHELQEQMEEMAGAPREAMGIRSPGEKTAFEVDRLSTAASRMFENKIGYFEEMFVEPLLNFMLEIARRNINASDLVRTVDNDFGVIQFLTISPDDLKAKGRLKPIGARHFATKNKIVQNLTSLSQTGLYQDPSINVHFSGWEMARLIEESMDLEGYNIVQRDVRVSENATTQQLVNTAQESTVATSLAPTESPDNADLTNEVPTSN